MATLITNAVSGELPEVPGMLLGLEITSGVLMAFGFLVYSSSYFPRRERTVKDKRVGLLGYVLFGLGFLMIMGIAVWG
jgi:hypothetical protein